MVVLRFPVFIVVFRYCCNKGCYSTGYSFALPTCDGSTRSLSTAVILVVVVALCPSLSRVVHVLPTTVTVWSPQLPFCYNESTSVYSPSQRILLSTVERIKVKVLNEAGKVFVCVCVSMCVHLPVYLFFFLFKMFNRFSTLSS